MKCKNFRTRTRVYYYCTMLDKEIQLKECSKCKNKNCKKIKPMKNISSKRAKKCDITSKVKKRVFARDNGKCVICDNCTNVMPNSHYIPRSHNGLGIEENVFTACTELSENKCHSRWEKYQCTKEEEQRVINNFKKNYPNWNEDMLVYKKYPNL